MIMIKKFAIIILVLAMACPSFCSFTIATTIPGEIYNGEESISYRNVTVYAPAVASTDTGYVGVISTITVTIQNNGSGRVFVDTLPLTEVDMQGSARLAVKVASTYVKNDENCTVDPSTYDYFFVVRTSSPVIGGPSAGGIMTVATISLLENWEMDNKTIMTGMINPDGSIGSIGGIPQKIDAANSVGATHFLIPKGQGTYTEWKTSTTVIGNRIITQTNPVTTNVADYAMDNYGITVTEVADVNEAIENFTGHTFYVHETDGNITTENYTESMKPLASTLLGDARQAYDNATSKKENTTIPTLSYSFRADVNEKYGTAKATLDSAEELYDEGLYYASTSNSFNSLISSRFVSYACDFLKSEDENFIPKLFDDVQSWYNNESEKTKDAKINGFISLQTVGAAQERASEAKSKIAEAKSTYEDRDVFGNYDLTLVLYDLAFAVERSNSINWWINIGTHFNETGEFNDTTLENLALDYIEEAQQAAVYSEILLQEMGVTTGDSADHLSKAETLLTTARDNLDHGLPAAALFEALEATIRANLAIEMVGFEAGDKINLARESASSKIAKSRAQGIEPVLAVSYYEYAESLVNNSDNASALLYYKYSDMIAGVLSFTNMSTGTASSRYVGMPEIVGPQSKNWFLENIDVIASIVILAGMVGLGLGLILGGLTLRKKEESEEWTPQFVEDYRKKPPRNPYFSQREMPRSIRDYYKKNK